MAVERLHTKLKIDLSLWKKNLHQAHEGLSCVLLEQRDGPLDERITYHQLYVDDFGGVRNSKTHENLLEGLRNETRIDGLEIAGVKNMSKWAANSKHDGYCLWISPPSEEARYVESRFLIWSLTVKDDKKTIEARGLCGHHDQQQCVGIANTFLDVFSDPDQLRQYPIPFLPRENVSWVNFLREKIGEGDVWQKIENGEDRQMKDNAEKVSKIIMQEFHPQIMNATSKWDLLRIQQQMEARAAQLGMPTQCNGSCDITIGNSNNLSPFERALQGPETRLSMPCPNPSCGGFVVVGSEKCTSCGLTKTEFDKKRAA